MLRQNKDSLRNAGCKVFEVDLKGDLVHIDTPEDLERAKQEYKEKGDNIFI